jgi:hypothetical protein
MSRLLALEWPYLTLEARNRAVNILAEGKIKDPELAIEMAIIELGDERAFELESDREDK